MAPLTMAAHVVVCSVSRNLAHIVLIKFGTLPTHGRTSSPQASKPSGSWMGSA